MRKLWKSTRSVQHEASTILGKRRRLALAAKRTAAEPALGSPASLCDCSFMQAPAAAGPEGAAAFRGYGSKVKITNVKVFGVSISPNSDRPYVFVKLETDAGLVGWGEGTLEGKAGAVMACINDFREFLIGADPMQSEHHWQSMYVHSFYRAGPVIGSAISGIDQAMWDLRGKILGLPVYKLLGGPNDPAGVRGYYEASGRNLEELRKLRETAASQGITCFKGGLPAYYEWIDTNDKINAAVQHIQMLREGLGPDIDVAVDFHAKTSPSVASIIAKEVEPLNLLWVEEPCPPENVKAMARICQANHHADCDGREAGGCLQLPRADRNGCGRHHPDGHESRGRHHRAMEGSDGGRGVGDFDGAAWLRGPDRIAGVLPSGFSHPELPDTGVLRQYRAPAA